MKKIYIVIENEYYTPNSAEIFNSLKEAEEHIIEQANISFDIKFKTYKEVLEYQESDEWQEDETNITYHIIEKSIQNKKEIKMNEDKILELANTLKKDGNVFFTHKDKDIFIENSKDDGIGFTLNAFNSEDNVKQNEMNFDYAVLSRTIKCDTEVEAISLSIEFLKGL